MRGSTRPASVRAGPLLNTESRGGPSVIVAGYLESGILTWGVPLALLVAIGIYWALYVSKHPDDF
jgi:hypothetical protein